VSRIADRFGRAAPTYGAASPIQKQVAAALADRIAAAGLAPGARVAEFGCGTGHLPAALWPRLRPALWVATDLSPQMAGAAARGLPEGGVVAVMDAARPALAPGFDLVCSSLTLQWIDDPVATVAGWRALVRPGGCLAVATLIEGTFAQWRAALEEAGVHDPGPAFASLPALKSWFGPDAQVQTLTLTDRRADGLDFARAARAAGIDAGPGRALNAGVMRRAMRAFEARGSAATYAAAIVIEIIEA
jgi:malonyl-CoA O-methyltransferase